MVTRRRTLFFTFFFISFFTAFAQPQEQAVKVIVAPHHTDWIYKTGEKARFTVTVL